MFTVLMLCSLVTVIYYKREVIFLCHTTVDIIICVDTISAMELYRIKWKNFIINGIAAYLRLYKTSHNLWISSLGDEQMWWEYVKHFWKENS
jgi:hypothetical protein